jgi:hypothetical protein
LKRTRLRRVSKTNSRPWLNESLRRDYREVFAVCELKHVIAKHHRDEIDMRDESAEVHHIHGGHPRYDMWSNFITCCRSVHEWIHAHPPDGKIVCIHRKLIVKRELDAAEFQQATGKTVAGWLSANEPRLDWVATLWRELVEVAAMGSD